MSTTSDDDENYKRVMAQVLGRDPVPAYAASDLRGPTLSGPGRKGAHYETLQRLQRPRTRPFTVTRPQQKPLAKSMRRCSIVASIVFAGIVIVPSFLLSVAYITQYMVS